MQLSLLVCLLPLLSWIGLTLLRKKNPPIAIWFVTLVMGIATCLCCYIFSTTWGGSVFHNRLTWFSIKAGSTDLQFSAGIYLDPIAALLLSITTLIASLIYLYSISYMQKGYSIYRYFTFLSLFMMVILGLFLTDNLLILFVFWELVGFSSYLLIGFRYQRESTTKASQKAFLINKLGDIGFLVGLLILWSELGTFDLVQLRAMVYTMADFNTSGWITVAGLCLFWGIIAKSAQFPLFNWLPKAMVALTPVSALLHAATMVIAGVYVLARIYTLLDTHVLTVIAFTGGITAFMGAYAALTQHNIKQVLAYSTISQLGYMMMAMGVGAYGVGLLHLTMHAFFKACLFLCAGAVILFMHRQGNNKLDVQDMRHMGGLRKVMPLIFYAYLIAALALVGVPFFSGSLSKEAILTSALSWAQLRSDTSHYFFYLIPILGFSASFLTVVYIGRQWILQKNR